MSFKIGRFFYFAISFIIGSFFFIIGVVSLLLPWSSFLTKFVIQFIAENTLVLSLFGLGFLLIGLSIAIHALLHARRRYIEIRLGTHSVALDEHIVRQYLEAYWHKHFLHAQVFFNLTLKRRSLQIVADFPFVPLSEQELFLEQVKEDFNDLFGRLLGYPHEVHLIASFQTHPTVRTSDHAPASSSG